MDPMQERVCAYWGRRADEYGAARLRDVGSRKWEEWRGLIAAYLPGAADGRPIRALDLGTGAGFFAFLLRDLGCEATGIDYTAEMIENAVRNREELQLDGVTFLQMDAQDMAFEDESFDFIFSRNVTWTLPHPEKAYAEMVRVLAPGGRLMNVDANYGASFLRQDELGLTEQAVCDAPSPYAHPAKSREMLRERNDIAESLSICGQNRPLWDAEVLTGLGIQRIYLDLNIQLHAFGAEYYTPMQPGEGNPSPLFLVLAQKD